MQEAGVEERLHEQRDAAGLEQVLGDVAAAGLQVGDIGRALEDLGDVEQVELDAAFMGDGRQVQGGVGRAAGGRDHGGRVLERLAGDDVARTDAAWRPDP